MAVPKRKTSKARRDSRRSANNNLTAPTLVECPQCHELKLPHAPEQFITYMEEDNRPQTGLDRDIYGGMGVTVGRLREDTMFDYKFVALSHNTLRGAAGGAMLTAEQTRQALEQADLLYDGPGEIVIENSLPGDKMLTLSRKLAGLA